LATLKKLLVPATVKEATGKENIAQMLRFVVADFELIDKEL